MQPEMELVPGIDTANSGQDVHEVKLEVAPMTSEYLPAGQALQISFPTESL